MASGFEVVPESLVDGAGRLDAHGERYAAAIRQLRERGTGGASWGDVGLFEVLRMAYAECSETALDAFTRLGDTIQATGDGLRQVAANTRATETTITAALQGDQWV
ncbi:hypothetical protein Sru01_05150 [Sphaerisporangium rufum]|uniref:ESX-1 secretion-associated protein n=1 Tax=Sphaerisporangium rufum TaxID=1381558 RepID=A0A919QYC3_9ACTN|nr:hypothetical protein [Sphaerisporangium rufum]GII75533.1 hypothetical protein Sru01_05150 [Sphaerisporangium rufum]